MSRMAKNLIVVLIAVLMFFSNAMTAVEAKGRGGRTPQPTPEPTVQPIEDDLIIEDEIPVEVPEEEVAEETEAPEEEEVIIEETEEEAAPEEEIPSEEVIAEETEPEIEFVDFQPGSTSEINAISDAPATEKKLIENGDGTYTLALSVTGAAESSSTTEVTKANVILVIDTSNSMNSNYTTYNGTRMTRLAAEKRVLTDDDGIIDSLLAQNVAGDPIKSDIIEVAIANFGTRGSTAQSFTTNATTLKNTVNGLTNTQGTNWEEGLMRAQELAASIKSSQPDEEVYIIFLTDGEPTTHNNSYNVNTNYATEWGYANDNARAIVTAGYHFYGIFTWGSGNSSHYLSSLVQYAYTGSGNSNTDLDAAYAQYFTDATDTETLISALSQIVHDITESVGYTNVELEDGVTSMTTSSVKTTASGEVTGLKYYRSGGSYSTTANNGLGEEWDDAPPATINDDGEVDWNLGNIVLENGVTYTVTFVVWPAQASVDLVADLNNGIVDYDSLTADQKSQISVSGGKYFLKTNTDYPTVTYSTVTTTTIDGETTTVVSDPKTATITNPDPVGLAGSKLNALKSWEDTLDPNQRKEIEDVVLYLLVDGHYYYLDEAGTPMGVTLTPESDWTYTDYINIAPGLFVTEDSPAYDPDAPHFTYDGVTYAMLETGHDYVFEESDINNHFELTAYTHHPMIMGTDAEGNPIIKDVIFTRDAAGKITGIESVADMGDNLSATNRLKGGINIEKKVVDMNGNAVDTADAFTVTVTLTDAEGNALPTKKAADGTEYTIDYRIYYGEKNPNYDPDATGTQRSDHIYKTGTSFDEVIYVGDVIRVVNVEDGALFTVTEKLTAGGAYSEEYDVEYTIAYGTENPREYTEDEIVDGNKYPVKGNSASNVKITNKQVEVFYVYHSSDNTIERIPMNNARVNNGAFNIIDETKSGCLYGGYYKAYGGQVLNDTEIKALGYSEAESGSYQYYADHPAKGEWASDDDAATPYSGDKATAWKKAQAYTADKGTAMKPAAGSVYYLKEVPDTYLRPYIQIVYDERAENEIKKLYKITATDDANYTQVGFNSAAGDDSSSKLAASIKITSKEYPNKNVTLTAKGIFTVPRGYLTSINTDFGSTFTMLPYFKTLDGVKVYGVMDRSVDPGNGKYTNKVKPGITTSDTASTKTYE